jgi:lysozyme
MMKMVKIFVRCLLKKAMQLSTTVEQKPKFGETIKMKISQEGLSLIKKFEGCPTDEDGNVVSYRCAANVATIGFGSTKYKGEPVEDGMKITMQEAEDLLIHEMDEYEGYINHMVESDLKQNEFDALVAWVFNLGPSNLSSSTLLQKLNNKDWDEVPNQIKRWNKAGGRVLEGLVRRREAEALLFEGKEWHEV